MEKKQQKQLIFGYDAEGDVLDISIGSPRKAISQEIDDDFFVRIDPKTKEVLGFMILNFRRQFQRKHTIPSIPVTGHFELVPR
jgi:uncharacterized protein YuzE